MSCELIVILLSQFLCDCIERTPDAALAGLQTELQEVFNVEISMQSVACALQQEGYTMKTVRCSFISSNTVHSYMLKITRPALEHNEQDHAEFHKLIAMHYHAEQLVFADESHFNWLTLRRPYAWSRRGEHACCYEFSFRGTKCSMLPHIMSQKIGVGHVKAHVGP